MHPRWRALAVFAVDLAVVAVFVSIGRASHREDQAQFAWTFWPFAVGLAAGWAAGRGWRAPFAIVGTGVPAWAGTVVVGMLLRACSGQGVQVTFVIVALIVTAVLLLGWRMLLVAMDRSASRGANHPGPVGYLLRRR